MKRTHLIFGLLIACTLSFTSCEEKFGDSIFDINPPERNRFDQWLFNTFVIPFNVEVFYRFEDIESDFKFNLLPAELAYSVKLAQMVEHVWFEAYVEAVSEDFLQRTVPRTLQFIGSAAHNANGSIVLGTAEGGMKVTLYLVNNLSQFMAQGIEALNHYYFHTMHHEFAHILHQEIMYDLDFRMITPNYIGNAWQELSLKEALERGSVSPYSLSAPDEDFVELFSKYITTEAATCDAWMQAAAAGIIRQGTPATSTTPAIPPFTGRDAIEQKFEILKSYMWNAWELDMDKMRDVSLRRAKEVMTMEFDMFEDIFD